MSAEIEDQKPIDYSTVKLERGPTPENIEQICLELCQQYLGGVWINLTIDEIQVKRHSCGLTNQMYFCSLNEVNQTEDLDVPQEVAILLYGSKFFNNTDIESDRRLTDTIISLLISENGLGPKIYGLFERGQIQKLYKHRNFEIQEQKDPELVDKVARKLAQIHAMDVPIKRTGNWIFHFFDHNYSLAKEKFDLNALIEQNKLETLKIYDIGEELLWLKKTMIECDSPFVFTHVDFRNTNIMITKSDGIVLCDFEYSCYGYRGFDFGTIFCEWGRTWGLWTEQEFASDLTIKPFIDSYIDESVKLRGKSFSDDIRNSYENLLKEVKLFSLVAYMWIIIFRLPDDQSHINGVPFDKIKSMKRTETVYAIYQKYKQEFIGQNLFRN